MRQKKRQENVKKTPQPTDRLGLSKLQMNKLLKPKIVAQSNTVSEIIKKNYQKKKKS